MARYRLPAVPALPRGVTVIEMMVVVMVLAIILALAVPSMRDFMARQRVKAVNAELVTDLQFARSEAVARNETVYVAFRSAPRDGSPPMTCYTIHTVTGAGVCDCRKPLGTACPNLAGLVEIKTVQVLRSTDVTVLPFDDAAPSNRLQFTGTQGLAGWGTHVKTQANYVADWQDFEVLVESTVSGKLRTSSNIVGRPQVCSPNGSITGVPQCP